MSYKQNIFLTLALLIFILCQVTVGQETAILRAQDIFHPVYAPNSMVASQEYHATREGLRVLQEGGNAVDAAVTVGFVLAVTLPRAGNIGGGGFMLIHLAESNTTLAIDYREKAPKLATENMFLDKQGNVDTEKARYSYLSAGVPGTVAGLILALEKYGTLPLKRVLQPAIQLAEKGMVVTPQLRDGLISAQERFKACPASMKAFFKSDGSAYEVGEKTGAVGFGLVA